MSNSDEIESQMILRVPDNIAEQINALIDYQNDAADNVELVPQIIKNRHGEEVTMFKFRLNNFESRASLIDLPCVIESQKTLDDVNYFKSANISQMIYVHPNNEEEFDQSWLISKKLP